MSCTGDIGIMAGDVSRSLSEITLDLGISHLMRRKGHHGNRLHSGSVLGETGEYLRE